MRKLVIAAAIGLTAILALILGLPVLVDSRLSHGWIEERLRKAAGQDVAVTGPVRLHLLPRPGLAAEDLRAKDARIARADLDLSGVLTIEEARFDRLPALDVASATVTPQEGGAYRVSGKAGFRKIPLAFDAVVTPGQPQAVTGTFASETGGIRGGYRAVLGEPPDFDLALTLPGQGAISLTGSPADAAFAVHAEDGAEEGRAVTGRLSVEGGMARLDGLEGRFGGTAVTGSGAVDFSRYPVLGIDLSLSGFNPGPIRIAAETVVEDDKRLAFRKLSGVLGDLPVEGELFLARAEPRMLLTGTLRFADLDLDHLLAMRRRVQPAAKPASEAHGPSPSAAPAPASTPTPAPAPARAGPALDAELTLIARSLAYGKWRLADPEAAFAYSGGEPVLRRFKGVFFGGTVEGDGRLVGEAGYETRLALRQAELKPLLAAAGARAVTGRLDLDLALRAGGKNEAELLRSLNGTARLAARDGAIAGIDMRRLSDRLDAANRPKDLLELLRGIGEGETKYRALNGDFAIKDGVARTGDLHLAADAAEGGATAAIDLPARRLESRTEFRLTEHPAAPPLVIHVDGAFEQPRTVFEVNGIERYLLQRLAAPRDGEKKGTRERFKDALKGLLGR